MNRVIAFFICLLIFGGLFGLVLTIIGYIVNWLN